MNLWKQWSRKVDGWVERRRRFQKTGAERKLELAEKEVSVGAGTRPATSVADSGKTR
jgi:hypothetical protein